MGMYTRARTPSNIGYVAVSIDGEVYIGVTTDLKRRSADHSRYGLTVIQSESIEQPYSWWERRATRFYDAQSQEEDFTVLNKTNRIRRES